MRSLRFRLTALVVALVAVVLVALAVVLFVGVRRAAWQQHDAGLASRARALAAIIEHDDDGYELELPLDPPGEPPTFIEIWKPDGAVLARSATLHGDLARGAAALGHPVLSDLTLPDGRAGRSITFRFEPRGELRTEPPEQLVLVLAEGTEHVAATVATVRTWFLVLGVLGLAAIAIVTAWSLGRGLRPLARLASDVERIDDRSLATRLPIDGQPTELEVPIRKLNELLSRLEASFARERQFTADVSHELRTPLAGLRTLLEVTALVERSIPDYRTALEGAHAIVLQLGAIVENLLTLARLDAGQVELDSGDVDLRHLVDECWKPHAELAASRRLEFRNRIAAGTTTRTDREKLRIVVSNLLANAAEYTETGGWIEVADGDALLEVTDSGPPIPAPQLDRIFDRLWRADTARSSTGIHCGIGLSLARSLCETLSLSLTATSADHVRFRITPARTDRSAHA